MLPIGSAFISIDMVKLSVESNSTTSLSGTVIPALGAPPEKSMALPSQPATHIESAPFSSVPLEVPNSSATVVPLVSSSFQCAIGLT